MPARNRHAERVNERRAEQPVERPGAEPCRRLRLLSALLLDLRLAGRELHARLQRQDADARVRVTGRAPVAEQARVTESLELPFVGVERARMMFEIVGVAAVHVRHHRLQLDAGGDRESQGSRPRLGVGQPLGDVADALGPVRLRVAVPQLVLGDRLVSDVERPATGQALRTERLERTAFRSAVGERGSGRQQSGRQQHGGDATRCAHAISRAPARRAGPACGRAR